MTYRNLVLATTALAFAYATSALGQELYDPSAAAESATTSEMEAPQGEAYHYGAGQFEECVTITFEGGGHAAPIGDVPGT